MKKLFLLMFLVLPGISWAAPPVASTTPAFSASVQKSWEPMRTKPTNLFRGGLASYEPAVSYRNQGSLLVACVYTNTATPPTATYAGRPMALLGSIPFPGGIYAGVSMLALEHPPIGQHSFEIVSDALGAVALASYGTGPLVVRTSSTEVFAQPSDERSVVLKTKAGEYVVGCHTNSNATVGYGSLSAGTVRAAFPNMAGIMFDSNLAPFEALISWDGEGTGGEILAAFCPLSPRGGGPGCHPRQGSRHGR
jgi:hypothetical protein